MAGAPGLVMVIALALAANQRVTGEGPDEWYTASAALPLLTSAADPLRELPPPEYRRLRTEALAKAQVGSGPVVKNPKAQNGGIDPAVFAALQEQRTFLQGQRGAPQLRGTARRGPSGEFGIASRNNAASVPPRETTKKCREPRILSVNGRPSAPVFTPQPPDNRYKIKGCLFGERAGRVQLKLGSGHGSLRPLVLRFESPASWSNEEIGVEIDPAVSRLQDYTGQVTLQVITATEQVLELPGCSFIAVREQPRLLNFIPSSWARLNTGAQLRPLGEVEYLSPPIGNVPAVLGGSSAFIARSDAEYFPPGADSFDFSRLLNGWIVDSAQLESYSVSCPGTVISSSFSPVQELQWAGRGLQVRYQGASCTSRVAPDYRFSISTSVYALKIWIVGPAQTEFMEARRP